MISQTIEVTAIAWFSVVFCCGFLFGIVLGFVIGRIGRWFNSPSM